MFYEDDEQSAGEGGQLIAQHYISEWLSFPLTLNELKDLHNNDNVDNN